MSRRKSQGNDAVEPDLPITPMLDMSFQLLAFFILTFNPTPTEGQIAMSLPPPDQGGGAGIPSVTDEKPMKWVVTVPATDEGAIAKMTIREEGGADDKGEDLGADVNNFLKKVRALADAEKKKRDAVAADNERRAAGDKKPLPPPPKLTLELGDKLSQGYVIQLFDSAAQAGFTDIAPVPIDKSKR